MPLFDFECKACQHRYEATSRYGEALPPCPKCNSDDVSKIPGMGHVRFQLPERFSWENPRFRGITHTTKKLPKP